MHIHLPYLRLFLFLSVITLVACKNGNTTTDTKDTIAAASSSPILRDSLPKSVGYINDFDSLYTKEQIQEFEKLLSGFEQKTTIEIAVITVDTMMVKPYGLDSFTLKIANHWGVGKKDKNNGIVIGICKLCREIVIKNGYGIEKGLTNEETKKIIESGFIGGFMNNNYYDGTIVGLRDLIKILEEKLRLKLIQ